MATVTTAMIIEAGIDAYKRHRFSDAESMFLQAVHNEPFNWRARLLLGASQLKLGDAFSATTQFSFLRTNCTDADVRERARLALQAMNEHSDAMPQFLGV